VPFQTLTYRKEKKMSSFNTWKDHLRLLLGGNAEGDTKPKPPLVYHPQNPGALKNGIKHNCQRYGNATRRHG
jgi:hypothetical protein